MGITYNNWSNAYIETERAVQSRAWTGFESRAVRIIQKLRNPSAVAGNQNVECVNKYIICMYESNDE